MATAVSDDGDELIAVTVAASGGTKLAISIAKTASVLELKNRIAAEIDLPAASQRLIFAGHVLDDAKDLASYGVSASGLTICLVRGLRRSGTTPTSTPTDPAPVPTPASASPSPSPTPTAPFSSPYASSPFPSPFPSPFATPSPSPSPTPSLFGGLGGFGGGAFGGLGGFGGGRSGGGGAGGRW